MPCIKNGCESASSGTRLRQIGSVRSLRDSVWNVVLHHCIISSRSLRFSAGPAEVAASWLPSWLRIPRESAVPVPAVELEGERSPDAGSPACPLSDPSFAHSREVDDPYSHSEWRLAQLVQNGRASSHYDGMSVLLFFNFFLLRFPCFVPSLVFFYILCSRGEISDVVVGAP